MRVSYGHASARIVLDAPAVSGFTGRVVLNVTDGQARSITVQDPRTGKAVGRVVGTSAIRDAVLVGASARDRATVQGFTR